jgi:hypothetical protein
MHGAPLHEDDCPQLRETIDSRSELFCRYMLLDSCDLRLPLSFNNMPDYVLQEALVCSFKSVLVLQLLHYEAKFTFLGIIIHFSCC